MNDLAYKNMYLKITSLTKLLHTNDFNVFHTLHPLQSLNLPTDAFFAKSVHKIAFYILS